MATSKYPAITLIIPPSPFLLDERVFVSLGILRVAAVLEQAGVKVELLDLSGVKNYLDVIGDYARIRTDIEHFGLTTTTPQLPASTKIATVIRENNRQAKIILGGPHVTLVNAACKKELTARRATLAMNQLRDHFDILVAGDGEISIFEAIGPNAPQIIDGDDTNSRLFLNDEDLDKLPFPARHLVDFESYHYTIDGIPATSLIAQLGCPFNCGFCGGRRSPTFRRIRTRTSGSIIKEMLHIYHSTGKKGYMFYDDELNVNKNIILLMRLITKTQKDLGIEWRLRGFIKSELFTDEQAEAMQEAGFRWILVGFESGSAQILRAINKKATREENSRCLAIAKRHGLKIKALISIGHPDESSDTIKETEDWLLENRPDDFDVSIITCYPGTPYYDEATPHPDTKGVWTYTTSKGEKLHQIEVDYTTTADYYKGDPDGGYHSFVYTDYLQPEELVRERNRLESNVRDKLHLPFNRSAPSILYEHSMGQNRDFPLNILRKTS